LTRARVVAWSVLVRFLPALGSASRFTGDQSDARDAVYSYATFAGGVIQYAVWGSIVFAIGAGAPYLFALRKPNSSGRALALGVAVLIGIFAVGAIVSALPIENPGDEQGLTPTVWEPAHAGAFAANCVLFCVIAPFVEELTFRGVGQSLLYEVVGRWPSILIVGVSFGVAHGLVDALLVLVPFGIFLAILRDRVDSVYPGMVVHGLFNGLALAASVLS